MKSTRIKPTRIIFTYPLSSFPLLSQTQSILLVFLSMDRLYLNFTFNLFYFILFHSILFKYIIVAFHPFHLKDKTKVPFLFHYFNISLFYYFNVSTLTSTSYIYYSLSHFSLFIFLFFSFLFLIYKVQYIILSNHSSISSLNYWIQYIIVFSNR